MKKIYYAILIAALPFLMYVIFKNYASPVLYANLTLASKILIDTPSCKLQDLGIIKLKRAHFSPKAGGTIDKYRCRPSSNKKIINELLNFDLIVASDFGGVVERIGRDGHVIWRSFFTNPRGITRDGLNFFVADQNQLYLLSVQDGSVLKSYTFPFIISKVRVENGKLWILSNEKKSSIFIYEEKNGQLENTKIINNVGNNARDFNFDSNFIYVADTFNHKVHKYLKINGELVSSFESFYPNSVDIIGGGAVLVAEEHNNAIVKFNFISMHRTVVHSCETGNGIEDVHELRAVANKPNFDADDSPCRVIGYDYLNKNIFSPNDAVYAADGLYIVDTDNHRIFHFDEIRNKAISVYGFNSPVSLLILK